MASKEDSGYTGGDSTTKHDNMILDEQMPVSPPGKADLSVRNKEMNEGLTADVHITGTTCETMKEDSKSNETAVEDAATASTGQIPMEQEVLCKEQSQLKETKANVLITGNSCETMKTTSESSQPTVGEAATSSTGQSSVGQEVLCKAQSQSKQTEAHSPENSTVNNSESVITDTKLYFEIRNTQWPIIYTPEYNIGFLGLEKLHPFDAGKWGRVFQFLKDAGLISDETTIRPFEAEEKDLLVVHTKKYLKSLCWSINVAGITEVPPVAILPNFIVQRKVLKPFRFHVGGTVLAGKVALERGWAVNLGGGFHHCSAERGGGFCAYADITLTIKFLFDLRPDLVKKAMIIDLDAHQGNGHERDFMNDDRVYILDVYNRGIYPHDGFAKRAINQKVELQHFTDDTVYLEIVRKYVRKSFQEFTPDVVVYNAGTDILDGDPLGCLSISPQGIIDRDMIVFQETRSRNIPIVMVTSGGYQRSTARIIADSILNLHQKRLILCEEAQSYLSRKESSKMKLKL